jgi:hypothetical protein
MKTYYPIAIALLLQFSVIEVSGQIVPPPPGGDGGIDPDEVVIHYPSIEFANMQEAIDALPDGGRLIIGPGTYDIPVPLNISKRIAIQGAGCQLSSKLSFDATSPNQMLAVLNAADAGGKPFSQVPFTRLIGPLPADVAAPEDSIGLLNFFGPDAGGRVQGVELVGYDAGISLINEPDVSDIGGEPPADADAVDVETLSVIDSCIFQTSRGIHARTTAALTLARVVIRDVLWNGISYSLPSGAARQAIGIITADSVVVLQARNACMYFNNATAHVDYNFLNNCGPQGAIGAIDSVLSVYFTHISNVNGIGILLLRSFANVNKSEIRRARIHGIYLNRSWLNLNETDIRDTLPRSSDGFFGDGISAFDSSAAVMTKNRIFDSARAGVANFGSRMTLGDNRIQCAGYELEGENHPQPADKFKFEDLGGNVCGCPNANGACVAVSAGLAPPESTVPIE